jgi:hypothetical protein
MSLPSSRSKVLPSLAVIVICLATAIGSGVAMREARSAYCPCSASAAMVVLTGTTITAYVEAWIAYLYIMLANNFSALNMQINANNNSFQEARSHQIMAKANNDRQSLAFRQNLRQTEDPDFKFQATLSAISGGLDSQTYATQQAILDENIEWLRGLSVDTAGTTETNASQRLRYHEQKYCDEREAEEGHCTAVEEALQGADREAASLYDYSVMSPKFRDAAIDFCRNLVGPLTAQPGKETQNLFDNEAVVQRYSHDARMAMVLQVCQYIVSLRAEVPDGQVASWAEQMRKLISGLESGVPDYLSDHSPEAVGSSMNEILSFAATYRASNARWFAHTQALPDITSVLKQIVAMRATKMFLKWKRYEVQQLTAGAIAAIQAAESEQNYFDKGTDERKPANF